MQNGTTTLENILVISYKLKLILNIRPNNSTQVFLPKEKKNELNESTCLHKDLGTNVYISIVRNSIKVETTEIH